MNFEQVKMFYQEKGLLENAAAIKRFHYSALGSDLKKQTLLQKINISFYS